MQEKLARHTPDSTTIFLEIRFVSTFLYKDTKINKMLPQEGLRLVCFDGETPRIVVASAEDCQGTGDGEEKVVLQSINQWLPEHTSFTKNTDWGKHVFVHGTDGQTFQVKKKGASVVSNAMTIARKKLQNAEITEVFAHMYTDGVLQ